MKARLLPAVLLFAPVAAFAQGSPYFGISVFNWSHDVDYADEASASGIRLTAGRELNENLSLEGQFATGGTDSVATYLGPTDVELDSLVSVMLKPHTSGEDFRVYGLFGFTRGEVTYSQRGSLSEDDSGLSYGAGVEVALGDRAWLTFDYVNYLRDDTYTAEALSIGTRLEF